jgi:hypothetical protein
MKIAILLDLDNIKNENSLSRIFVEIPQMGEVIFKYGFYSNFNDKNIKRILHQYGIVPIMFPSFVGNKSCADISLTIKAMDLLKNPLVDCFAIVSNDSDFISLSARLKEDNIKTILVTDKESVNKEKYNFFDEGIDIYDLLNPKSVSDEILVSDMEISVLSGEKDENEEKEKSVIDKNEYKNKLITGEVDNIKYIDFNNENPEVKELLTRIEVAFKNIAIEDDYARLGMLIEYLNSDGKKFNPKDYGHSNRRVKDFFEKRLYKYFHIDIRNSTAFIKFKTEVI